MHFESLLSCQGDEIGMVEDFAVGVADLSHVTLKLKKVPSKDDIMPIVEGNR